MHRCHRRRKAQLRNDLSSIQTQQHISALQDPQTAAPFYQRLALHFEQAQSLEEAERYYIKAGLARKVSKLTASCSRAVMLCVCLCPLSSSSHDHGSESWCRPEVIAPVTAT